MENLKEKLSGEVQILEEFLKEYQVSASALARALGVSATSISFLRKGEYRNKIL